MVESLYWKEELDRIATAIRPVSKPRRWSERAVGIVERDVMIGFFIVRRMIELHKVSSSIAGMQLEVFKTPTSKKVTLLNNHALEENYDWGAEEAVKRKASYITNQCRRGKWRRIWV